MSEQSETSRASRIEARAHQMWEQEGRPEGRREHHWAEAEREIDAADGGSAAPDPTAGTIAQAPRWEGLEESRPSGYLPAADDPAANPDAMGETLDDADRARSGDVSARRRAK